MEKNCQNCRYYRAYYKKGLANFYRARNTGLCIQQQKAVEKKERCDLFLSRIPVKKEVTVEYIDQVIKDIEELEWIYRDYNY